MTQMVIHLEYTWYITSLRIQNFLPVGVPRCLSHGASGTVLLWYISLRCWPAGGLRVGLTIRLAPALQQVTLLYPASNSLLRRLVCLRLPAGGQLTSQAEWKKTFSTVTVTVSRRQSR